MRYPCLVPKFLCKTPVHIQIEQEGLTKYGEPLETIELDEFCNYQDKSTTKITASKKEVQINGVAMIPGDVAPELPVISGGTILVNGVERTIIMGTKARNPDGTVNHTILEVQ